MGLQMRPQRFAHPSTGPAGPGTRLVPGPLPDLRQTFARPLPGALPDLCQVLCQTPAPATLPPPAHTQISVSEVSSSVFLLDFPPPCLLLLSYPHPSCLAFGEGTKTCIFCHLLAF